jgi:hypothetical protein
MTAEIVSALNNLTAVNKELAGKRQAEADKEAQDRADERNKLQKIIDNGKKSETDRNEAKDELRKLNKKEDLAKEVSTEISRSAAALLGISDEQFKSSKEQQLIQKDQGKSTEKVIEEIKKSTVDPLAERKNAAAIMEAQLIANGRVATQNAAYNREMSAIKQEEIKARRDQAETPAERAEIQAELDAERKKNQGLLGKIAGGLGGLLKQGKEKVVGAVKGVFGFIKGLAIAGLGLALVAFLNSPLWEDTKTYIVKTLIPTLGRFYDAFFGPKGGFINGLKELFGDKDGIGGIVLGIGTVVAALVAFKIVSIVSAIISSITAIKLAFTSMKAQFLLTKTGMLAMKAKAILMNAPLLPLIAIAAGIALVIGALKAAFDEFQKTMEETGSVTEALKAGASKFMRFLVEFPAKLIGDLGGWVLNKLGFENAAKKLKAITDDPIKSITDGVSDLMTTVGKFFEDIFDFDFFSFLKTIPGAGKVMDFLGIGGGEGKGKGKGMEKAAAQLKYGDAGYGRGNVESKGFLSTVGSMFGSDDEGNLAPVNAVPRQKSKRRLEIERRSAEIIERKKNMSAEQIQSMREMKIAMNTIPTAAPVVVNAPSTNVNSNSSSSASYISTPLTNNNPQVKAINYSF